MLDSIPSLCRPRSKNAIPSEASVCLQGQRECVNRNSCLQAVWAWEVGIAGIRSVPELQILRESICSPDGPLLFKCGHSLQLKTFLNSLKSNPVKDFYLIFTQSFPQHLNVHSAKASPLFLLVFSDWLFDCVDLALIGLRSKCRALC